MEAGDIGEQVSDVIINNKQTVALEPEKLVSVEEAPVITDT